MTATKKLRRRKRPYRSTKGPRPWSQRHASTLFVRIPSQDWPLVKRGLQRVVVGGTSLQTRLFNTRTPTPVVAYAIKRGQKEHDSRLMILEAVRRDRLGAIDPAEAGFPNLGEFRRYWMARERNGRGFQPLRLVWVYTLRPFVDGDREEMGLMLFDRLYGEHVNGG